MVVLKTLIFVWPSQHSTAAKIPNIRGCPSRDFFSVHSQIFKSLQQDVTRAIITLYLLLFLKDKKCKSRTFQEGNKNWQTFMIDKNLLKLDTKNVIFFSLMFYWFWICPKVEFNCKSMTTFEVNSGSAKTIFETVDLRIF